VVYQAKEISLGRAIKFMNVEKAVFGGGCFWCTEAVFKSLKGVYKVLPGYARAEAGQAGGTVPPTYQEVSTGKTGYAEVVYIEYDPEEVSYRDLLTVFFGSHDPTTLNRQGSDIGTQYRSVVFYTTEEQKKEAEKFVGEIEGAVTEVVPFKEFFEAEDYHKNYYERHKDAPYCQLVINPKLDKVQEKFNNLLKSHG
jgi:peptide-methionine (S)-S-oxide reductase